uniref:cytochrome f n=1 Tax=Goniotrichopsis reniformis TaxID=468933 RepID=UPI001FCD3849|nr:cytochrome f [Goniotrichopsis reniformis]UNJ14793.1 cytochrome f [Goniotrichopsis reniformis]
MIHYNSLIHSVRKIKALALAMIFMLISVLALTPQNSQAYPIFAQTAYDNPREATGRIVCANCHLAQKAVEIEVPKSVLPDTVFTASIKIPYSLDSKQIQANGNKGGLNVGAVLILPEGFKLAPKDRLDEKLLEETNGVAIQTYSANQSNILVVGPISGDQHQEIIFPILSPDPSKDKNVYFIKYPVYVGGNRGRGQIYPSGDKSNNNIYNASTDGQIAKIETIDQKGYNITIATDNGNEVVENIPAGLELAVTQGDEIKTDQALTFNPNVGGFGQNETEIVLQNPLRIKLMIAFFFTVVVGQTFLILKKKQFEKVQAAEMNF